MYIITLNPFTIYIFTYYLYKLQSYVFVSKANHVAARVICWLSGGDNTKNKCKWTSIFSKCSLCGLLNVIVKNNLWLMQSTGLLIKKNKNYSLLKLRACLYWLYAINTAKIFYSRLNATQVFFFYLVFGYTTKCNV